MTNPLEQAIEAFEEVSNDYNEGSHPLESYINGTLKDLKAHLPVYNQLLQLAKDVQWKPISEAPKDRWFPAATKNKDYCGDAKWDKYSNSWYMVALGFEGNFEDGYYRPIIDLANYPLLLPLVEEG